MTSVVGGMLVRNLDRLSVVVALFATAYHFLTVWAVPHGATRHYTVHLGLMLLLVAIATARRWTERGARLSAGHAAMLGVFVVAVLALALMEVRAKLHSISANLAALAGALETVESEHLRPLEPAVKAINAQFDVILSALPGIAKKAAVVAERRPT